MHAICSPTKISSGKLQHFESLLRHLVGSVVPQWPPKSLVDNLCNLCMLLMLGMKYDPVYNERDSKYDDIWVVVSNIFYLYPYLRKWSNLTNAFQMGWFNHQPAIYSERDSKCPTSSRTLSVSFGVWIGDRFFGIQILFSGGGPGCLGIISYMPFPTPRKINMEHNHGGLEDHFPF